MWRKISLLALLFLFSLLPLLRSYSQDSSSKESTESSKESHLRILSILEKQKEELSGLKESQPKKDELVNSSNQLIDNLDSNINKTDKELQQQTDTTTKQEPLLKDLSVKTDYKTGIIIGLAATVAIEFAIIIISNIF